MVEGFFPGGPVVRSQDVLKKWEQEIQISLRQLSTGTQLNRFFQGVRVNACAVSTTIGNAALFAISKR